MSESINTESARLSTEMAEYIRVSTNLALANQRIAEQDVEIGELKRKLNSANLHLESLKMRHADIMTQSCVEPKSDETVDKYLKCFKELGREMARQAVEKKKMLDFLERVVESQEIEQGLKQAEKEEQKH